jgi:two-component system response regulator YesN
LTVSEVAGSVGFSDPLYFSRVFRKDKGMTPTEYQKKAAKPEQTADKL